jgi:hypothetical protein
MANCDTDRIQFAVVGCEAANNKLGPEFRLLKARI